MASQSEQKSFKDTLNLPQTEFPIRPNPAKEDPELLARWAQEDLYRASFELNEGNPKYILHVGPPYANGHIHLGHAYTKILKDIVTKSRRMMGYHVPVTPGWDCHGLPIEIKVVQEQPGLSPDDLVKACREYAHKWINIQRTEFKNLGVLMDWDRPYLTMSTAYEADTVRAFAQLVDQGFVERKNKTVPWCATCETVLAMAEIEYKDRKDPSVYVAFDMEKEGTQKLFSDLDKPVSILVWTTTPWTLPLNQALLIKPKATYVVLDLGERYGLLAEDVSDSFCALLQREKKVIKRISAEELIGTRFIHPFIDKTVPLLLDDSVSSSEGTACVHCAPGCGPTDYEIGVKNLLDIYSPITSKGEYSSLIEPSDLEGMKVTDGQWWVLKKLAEVNKLLYKGSITHSYPHCWRCHNGLIFRATPQWFFDLNRQNIKQRVLEVIESTSFIPPQGRSFLRATVENRWEWCLSRQRIWGTPIPAVICTSCDEAYLSYDMIMKVAQGIEQEGIEYWHRVQIQELLDHLVCKKCKGTDFKKEFDILDVWLDAGVSNYAVLKKNPLLAFPADLYLEGTDQYRGWFQSSLIMSMVLNGETCTRTFMTHGFTVDQHGHKMSKSLGNVVAPQELIDKLGTDGLRLWVASIGHESDAIVSDMLIKNVAEVNRKIRNTCRFLLSNLYDFNEEQNSVVVDELLPVDYYALVRLSQINASILKRYNNCDFTGVFHELAQYTSVELSSYYLDIVKDRLYCEGHDSKERRSAQTVLWILLDTLTRLIAPIMSFTAEQISDTYQRDKKVSIHLQPFVDPDKLHEALYKKTHILPGLREPYAGGVWRVSDEMTHWQQENLFLDQWELLKEVRSVLLKALEIEREKGVIKHSLEASITFYADTARPEFASLQGLFDGIKARGISLDDFFKEYLVVSNFKFASSAGTIPHSTMQGIHVNVEVAAGLKCPRCWKYDTSGHPDGLCSRCEKVLNSMKEVR